MPGMTDRDHFAAAALTGLLASREWPIDSDEAAHYCYRVADAMLRERERTNHDAAPAATASLPTADHAVCRGRESGCGTGGQPAIDRLREWERHGSGRWGLGAAGDVTMIERRLAMLEAVHDAAPAAIVPEPEPSAARRRPAGGTGDTTHDAAPAARAPEPEPEPAARRRPAGGTGDTQEPVAWGVAGSNGLLYATSVSRMDAVDMQSEHECDTHVVPLYRQPTLTDAEREAIYRASQYLSQNDVFEGMAEDAATLRGLLERMK